MNPSKERALAALMATRGGVFTTAAATRAGLNRTDLHRADANGMIRRLGRGVWGPPDQRDADLEVIAGAAGWSDSAIVSHRAAAWIHGFDGIAAARGEISVPHSGRRPRSEPGVHRRRRFDEVEVVQLHGLWVTSAAQTLADLGAVVGPDIVERAVESALRMETVTDSELRSFAEKANTHRWGNGVLHRVLALRPADSRPTGSDVETICLQSYRAGGVPDPIRQMAIEVDGTTFFADFGWTIRALTEIDGLATHADERALAYDLSRQNAILDVRYEIRRFTALDVLNRPRYVCTETLRGLEVAAERFGGVTNVTHLAG